TTSAASKSLLSSGLRSPHTISFNTFSQTLATSLASASQFLLLLHQCGWHIGCSGSKPLENLCRLTVSGTVEDSGAFLKRLFEPNPVVRGHSCSLARLAQITWHLRARLQRWFISISYSLARCLKSSGSGAKWARAASSCADDKGASNSRLRA